MKRIDLTGQKFGMLTVVEKCGKDKSGKNVLWLCECECGGITKVSTSHLRCGHAQSCGCKKRENLAVGGEQFRFRDIHGLSRTRVYRIWSGMKSRCSNPKVNKYPLYGGRGIEVCDEWMRDVCAFYEWAVSNGYADNLTIDRIDCDGNYEPGNCRWVSVAEQNRNRRCCKAR